VQSRKIKDPIEEVIALACLGYDYRLFGDNAKSWKYNLEAIALAEKNPNEEAKSVAFLALAMNYQDISDFPKAIKLFSNAVDCASRTKFDMVLSICYSGLADLYFIMNKIDSSLVYAQRGYEINMRIGYDDYLGPLLQQLGSIHARLGNSDLAISYFDLAIKQGYKIKSPKFINTSYTAKAQYYYDAHQPDSAILYCKKAIASVQNTAFTNFGLTPAKLLLNIYRNKNIDSAFKYSEIYRIANDSLFNAKTIQQTQLLAFEENVRQQQLSEEKLKADEQRKQNIQYALIALGIISFIILYLLLSRSFITNTKLIEFFGVIALLIVFEFLNLLLHPFLEKITHHSPVLMLLALVGIAALLVPLHHKVEKWSTEKLIEKNKAIRLANAKKTIAKLEEKPDLLKD
jgi:tetratricopeptide (TPR) repeat protein